MKIEVNQNKIQILAMKRNFFEFQKVLFVFYSAAVTGYRAVRAEHSVAGNDYTYRVRADRAANRPGGHSFYAAFFGDYRCNLAVSHRFSVGNSHHYSGNRFLKRRKRGHA